MDETTTCHDCGLTYFYAPKYHECADKSIALPTTTWVEECMAKQYGPRVNLRG